MNRPAEMNSISKTLLKELTAVLSEAEQDDSVRVLVLSGKGKAFCAGVFGK
ncbi:enoyl-CoA hydratase/isomerase family protein [Bacillus rubiinfantis]|uniref:enoyl-CoA hydratase/isomerase family protein n=1 Tax=Bacillus rubiinfantis TaxID=1499680 RepID=UPI0009E5751C|nr:enoyl-CoA hydratase/isomerase family protein [Bacillus rubiinfantis]